MQLHFWLGRFYVGSCLIFHAALLPEQEALKVLQFTEEEIRDMFKLLSGVLQLGNIEFMTAGGAQITTKQGQLRRNVSLEM